MVAVDDDNAIRMPAECEGALSESILALGALGVFQDLTRRGLPDVEIGVPLQVRGVHLVHVALHRLASVG